MPLSAEKMKAEFNIMGQCRLLRLPPWRCPRFLFLGMGVFTIVIMVSVFLYFQGKIEPESMALVAAAIASILVLQTYFIVLAFEKVAELHRLKSEFINIISHQLRSPLTSARWAMELLGNHVENNDPPSEYTRYTAIIEQSMGRMAELINELLNLNRVETKQFRFHPEAFLLSEIVEERIAQLGPLAEALNIEIIKEMPVEALEVFSDRNQVRFVFENLLDNAIRYSRAYGKIYVRLAKENNEVKCSVADNGIGIPLAEQPHIFSQFFRASNATAHLPGGTGLGLFISREIVRLARGRIGFSSDAGKGSSFWFTLPLATAEQRGTS